MSAPPPPVLLLLSSLHHSIPFLRPGVVFFLPPRFWVLHVRYHHTQGIQDSAHERVTVLPHVMMNPTHQQHVLTYISPPPNRLL